MSHPGARRHPLRRALALVVLATSVTFVGGVAASTASGAATCLTTLNNDSYFTAENTNLTVGDSGVLVNDTLCTDGAAQLLTGTSHGVVTLNAGGGFTYDPNSGYSGLDSFTYTYGTIVTGERAAVAKTGIGPLLSATVTIDVTPTCTDTRVDDAYAGSQDTPLVVAAPGVLANDVVCSKAADVHLLTPPTKGTVTNFNFGTGGFTYTPNPGTSGVDTFTYEVAPLADDDRAPSASAVADFSATVTLTIAPTPVTTVPPVIIVTTTTTTTEPTTTTTEVATTTEGTDTTVAPTSEVTTTTSGAVEGTSGDQGTSGGALARTGADIGSIVVFGVLLLGAGLVLAAASRRRRSEV